MGARVLLVDGEAGLRRRLSAVLGKAGCEVREAADGLAALQALDERSRAGAAFQVVVVDAGLADIAGLKLVTLIKSRFPSTKVVVLGQPVGPTAEQVTQRGGDALLVRPVDGERLAALVREFGATKAVESKAAAPAPVRPDSGWVLVRLDKTLDPLKVLADLGCCAMSVHCDAVRDEKFGIVQVLRGPKAEIADQAKRLLENRPGVVGWELVPGGAPKLDDGMRAFLDAYDRDHAGDAANKRELAKAASYVAVEANPPDLAGLYVRLYLLDEALEVDADVAGGRVLLLVQGEDFGHVRRVVHERLPALAGVTRVHEMKVVPYAKG
jgi:CheY-like chemotaxis protein